MNVMGFGSYNNLRSNLRLVVEIRAYIYLVTISKSNIEQRKVCLSLKNTIFFFKIKYFVCVLRINKFCFK